MTVAPPRYPKHSLGCDGCRAGWLVVERKSQELSWRLESNIGDIVAASSATLALIDMPIGLAESSSRDCDRAARQYLGKGFSSSVFPTPCRAALMAQTYPEANALNRQWTGKGLSKQSWYLFEKIRQIDDCLQRSPQLRGRLREAHPEVCFQALNGKPLKHKKKTPEGAEERLAILKNLNPSATALYREALAHTLRKNVAADDIIDALCLALAPTYGKLHTLPEQPELDSTGLAMEICYFA